MRCESYKLKYEWIISHSTDSIITCYKSGTLLVVHISTSLLSLWLCYAHAQTAAWALYIRRAPCSSGLVMYDPTGCAFCIIDMLPVAKYTIEVTCIITTRHFYTAPDWTVPLDSCVFQAMNSSSVWFLNGDLSAGIVSHHDNTNVGEMCLLFFKLGADHRNIASKIMYVYTNTLVLNPVITKPAAK